MSNMGRCFYQQRCWFRNGRQKSDRQSNLFCYNAKRLNQIGVIGQYGGFIKGTLKGISNQMNTEVHGGTFLFRFPYARHLWYRMRR